MRCSLGVLAATLLALITEQTSFCQQPTPTVHSNLRVAAAKVEITPPEGTPVVGHVREVSGARDPLHAVLLLLDDSQSKAAIVTLDLINAGSDMVSQLREGISASAGIPRENIMVATSHNHSGPGWGQSVWSRKVVQDIAAAARKASGEMRAVSIGYQEDVIAFNINRRQMIGGRSVVRLNPEGPCDHRVKVLRFDDGQSLDPVAVVMHAVCHPCVFTWGDKWSPPYPGGYPKMSADFPGEAKTFVERAYGGRSTVLFLQGCAGDIRPNLPGYPYRCGDETDIRWIGRSLGCATVRASDRSAIREEVSKRPVVYPIRCATSLVTLPAAKDGEKVQCELQAMKVGPFLLLTMPGEPMVEYGFRLEKAIADRAIPIIIGYANGHIGYICTKQAFTEGGYEPNHSQSGSGAEEILVSELLKLTDKVVGDVFEAFAPMKRP